MMQMEMVDEVEKYLHPDHLLRMMAIFTIRMGRPVIYKAWTVQMEHQKSSGTMIQENWSATTYYACVIKLNCNWRHIFLYFL